MIAVFALHVPCLALHAPTPHSMATDADTIARLMNELALADERARISDERAREAERARDEAALAAREAERARDAEALLSFRLQMRAISSSAAADSASGADFSRRGALEPTQGDPLNGVGVPQSDDDVNDAWVSFCGSMVLFAPPAIPPTTAFETRLVHRPLEYMLSAALPSSLSPLRMWHEAVAADDVPVAEARPDFLFTSRSDAVSSVCGSLFVLEVKRPGNLAGAMLQASAYARRRVAWLFEEGLQRGDDAAVLHSIFALAAGTDGDSIAFVRVSSGSPLEGGNYVGATPCPSIQSPSFPLLRGWNYESGAWNAGAGAAPSAGFLSLMRVLRAPLGNFGGGIPLLGLSVLLKPGSDRLHLTFSARLGVGGTSDVYSSQHLDKDCVVKVPRCATKEVVAMFAAETTALTKLEGAAGTPLLVARSERVVASPVKSHVALPWPVLIMRPAGIPLLLWLKSLHKDSLAAAADAVVSRLLVTLRAAHGKKIAHCDIRPSNIIVSEGGGGDSAVLIDWGLSSTFGSNMAGCGVAAFAASSVFANTSFSARPAADLESMAYTWVAIVHGHGAAPWPATEASLSASVRDDWLSSHGDELGVKKVLDYIRKVRSNKRADVSSWYSWE